MTIMAGTLHEDLFTFRIISCWILLRIRNASDELSRENQDAHLYSITFFPPKIVPLWDNVEENGRVAQATEDNMMQRMRCLCWTHEVTHTHTHKIRICNIFRFFPTATIVARTVLIYTNIACLAEYSSALHFSLYLQDRRLKKIYSWFVVEIISISAHVLIKSTQGHTDSHSWKQPFSDSGNAVPHKLFHMSEDIYAFAADRGPISFLRTSRCLWTNISGVEQCRRVDNQHEHGTQGLAVFVGTKHLHLCLHFPATTAVCSSPAPSGILLPLLLENFQFHWTWHLIVNIAYSTVAKVMCFVFLIQ
jgi:hypothetical protein